jgi:hypothetical protein
VCATDAARVRHRSRANLDASIDRVARNASKGVDRARSIASIAPSIGIDREGDGGRRSRDRSRTRRLDKT